MQKDLSYLLKQEKTLHEEYLAGEKKQIQTNVLIWTQAEFDAHWTEAYGSEGLVNKLSDLKHHKFSWEYRVGSGHKVLNLWFGAKADGTLKDHSKLMKALGAKAHAQLKADKTEVANFVFPSSLLEESAGELIGKFYSSFEAESFESNLKRVDEKAESDETKDKRERRNGSSVKSF